MHVSEAKRKSGYLRVVKRKKKQKVSKIEETKY